MTYVQTWPDAWGERPPFYPILGLYYDNMGDQRMTPDEFRIWARALTLVRPTFYSIYRAGVTRPELCPLLRTLEPYGELKDLSPTEEDYRAAAARAIEISAYLPMPTLAISRKAYQVLGENAIALGNEQRMCLNGYAWDWQLWTNGAQTLVLLTQEGRWELDDIRAVPVSG
jgi:hypothetical protein